MVGVEVGQKNIYPRGLRLEACSQAENPGPGVQHQDGPVIASDLHAGGIAPVTNRLGAWTREGPAGPPQRDPHGFLTGQNMATAPRCRSPWPSSGNAVSSMRFLTP